MTSSTKAAGNGSSVGSGAAWLFPERVTVLDTSRANCGVPPSAYLVSSDHGFAISGTPNAITLRYNANDVFSNAVEGEIYATKDGINPVGNNLASGSWTSSPVTYTRGGDLLGTTWSDTEINASTFGFMIKISSGSSASVDYMEIQVDYAAVDGDGTMLTNTSRIQISQRFKAA